MISIYTDGACIPNPGAGGWAYVVYDNAVEVHCAHGGLENTTNNVMELTGMLEALRWLRANRQIAIIHCDSQYVVKGCNDWRQRWAVSDWKTKTKKPVANVEIWKAISSELDRRPKLSVQICWVKGHAGIVGNERADHLTMVGAAAAAGVTVEELYAMERRMRAHFAGESI